MPDTHHFTRVNFHRFKAFEKFRLNLRSFNILVGPNNAGKSTILAAFRILAAGMRRAATRKPQSVTGPHGRTIGHRVDLTKISVAEENLFWNYDESLPASVKFRLSNGNELLLYFPEHGSCFLIPIDPSRDVRTPAIFKSRFNCQIAFVPILGPVEHNERLYAKEAARLALFSYRAARNFRNIWYHYPDKFEDFRILLRETWSGMDIERPIIELIDTKPVLYMFCPEERIPRELFWAGFGFQIWCQMLTHVVQARNASIFLIDEPDIYLHADLQRQLLSLLRNLGPDIVVATHSTEIITEAESDEIVFVDKHQQNARRIREAGELIDVFSILGSELNPILTQVAKTRRAVFVEGKDFQILGKLARRLNLTNIVNRGNFAVVPVDGFSADRIRSLKGGIEASLGGKIASAAILDRDYRSRDECESIKDQCEKLCDLVIVHSYKEVENFLLVPEALNRAAKRRVAERNRRTGGEGTMHLDLGNTMLQFACEQRPDVMSQHIDFRQRFERIRGSAEDQATVNKTALQDFETEWANDGRMFAMISGKEAFSYVNQRLQIECKVSITASGVIAAMYKAEIPQEAKSLLSEIAEFVSIRPNR